VFGEMRVGANLSPIPSHFSKKIFAPRNLLSLRLDSVQRRAWLKRSLNQPG